MLTFVVAVQNGHRLAWAAYVGLTVLSVYTVVLSALVVLVHAVCLLLRRRDQRWTSSAVAVGAMGLLVVPLGWVVADHGAQPIKWLPPPGPLFGATDRYLVEFFASARTDGAPFSNWTVDLLTLGMLLCWAVGLCLFLGSLARRRLATEPWGYGLLLAWFLLPPVITYLISVGIQPVLSDRYILTALPPASMIAGVALSRLRPWPVAVAPALIILALRAWVLVPGYGVPLENWRQGVIDVASRSQPHDCIAFFVADGYTAFDYYVLHLRSLPGPVPTPVLPRSSWLSRTPYALDPEAVPPSQMSQVVSSCPRLWLVSSHDLGSPPGPGVLPYRVRVYDAHKKLRAEVGAAYRQSAAWSFLGADVSLYVRRPQYDPHASPVRG
jgi:hypothetical protein